MSILKILIIIVAIILLGFGIYHFVLPSKFKGGDMVGDPLDPRQIAKRKENLNKILKLASQSRQITGGDVQKALGVSGDTAERYLEYLVNLGKLSRIADRGQQVVYKLV